MSISHDIAKEIHRLLSTKLIGPLAPLDISEVSPTNSIRMWRAKDFLEPVVLMRPSTIYGLCREGAGYLDRQSRDRWTFMGHEVIETHTLEEPWRIVFKAKERR